MVSTHFVTGSLLDTLCVLKKSIQTLEIRQNDDYMPCHAGTLSNRTPPAPTTPRIIEFSSNACMFDLLFTIDFRPRWN